MAMKKKTHKEMNKVAILMQMSRRQLKRQMLCDLTSLTGSIQPPHSSSDENDAIPICELLHFSEPNEPK